MKKVKLITPDLYLSESLAIVGSSGSLKDKKYGEKIDCYKHVVRFNRAPTDGFEDIVGAKRSLTVANMHVFANVQLKKKSGWKQDDVEFIRNLRNTRVLMFAPENKNWKNKDKNIHKTVKGHIVEYKKMQDILVEMGFVSKKQPTAGFGFIMLCVYSGLVPHLFGFDTEPRQRDHYWEKRDNNTSYHNITEEMRILKKMHKSGKILLHK